MNSRILREPGDVEALARFLSNQKLPLTVSWAKGANRTKAQNALAHKWYAQIAASYEGWTPAEAKAHCKLEFGLPIMERDKPDWVAKWEPLYGPLDYEAKTKLFEIIPLTSKMTVKQGIEYMDAVQREFISQGVLLVDPEARRYEQEFK